MVSALFDTNILIDYLNGVDQARAELEGQSGAAISIVTWMEVMAGAGPAVEDATRAFLDRFEVVAIDAAVAERAVALRRGHRLKLPDAIVWASAVTRGVPLVTRDTKGFPEGDAGIRIPYRL